MKKNMSWIKKKFFDFLIISMISVLILSILNFAFVYYSPILVKALPIKFVQLISPCYRTLIYSDEDNSKKVNYIFGDSFTEGIGDEFLNGDKEYGIFNKLDHLNSNNLIFGRSGYGNKGTVVEFKMCYPLLKAYTTLNTSLVKKYNVTFVFYEGNDLNNNLVEKDMEVNKFKYYLRFFLPLFEYIYREIKIISEKAKRLLIDPKSSITHSTHIYPVSASGVQLYAYPQSAATELSMAEIQKSLEVFFSSLEFIKNKLNEAEGFMILYLPSVASSYIFDGDIRVQSYLGNEYYTTNGIINSNRHDLIIESIRNEANSKGWYLCNTTSSILNYTSKRGAVHGPRDWKHFNKDGYYLVAQSYNECLEKM